jgi:hypothetical protein
MRRTRGTHRKAFLLKNLKEGDGLEDGGALLKLDLKK